jgi:electron transfer flavoprotein beta subunit
MKSKKKPIDTKAAADLGVETSSKLTTLNIAPPVERPAGIIVESVDELISKLKTEAKVI